MGNKCLFVTRVSGFSRLPVPPASTTPFMNSSHFRTADSTPRPERSDEIAQKSLNSHSDTTNKDRRTYHTKMPKSRSGRFSNYLVLLYIQRHSTSGPPMPFRAP